jgi:hypothetical protein
MNRLYALASVGFCVASAALITSASAFPTVGSTEDRTRIHRQGEDRRSGIGREQRDDHHATARWIF